MITPAANAKGFTCVSVEDVLVSTIAFLNAAAEARTVFALRQRHADFLERLADSLLRCTTLMILNRFRRKPKIIMYD